MLAKDSGSKKVSRREFLKLGGISLAGIWMPAMNLASNEPTYQGRVCVEKTDIYLKPSFSEKKDKSLWRDTVFPIIEATAGVGEPIHNRIWYKLNDGYVHSGDIQPVRTLINQVTSQIPEVGILGEVSVPFTDAYWAPKKDTPIAYRFYYATTHWVIALEQDETGNYWYKIADDKWDIFYYVPATHIRIFPNEELTPISPELPIDAKRVEVWTKEQAVIAYEWDRPVFMTRTATGAKFSNGDFSTPPGRHITAHKRPYRHMAAGNLAYNGYDLPGVPWVIYITESGISFHGTYWHNNYGRPRSHGCINLTPQAAKWLYRWTMPIVPPHEQFAYEEIGTPVDVV